MIKSIPILFFCFLLVSTACNNDQNPTPGEGEIFDLDFSKTADLWEAGMTIQFTAVEEGRCPKFAFCIWEGQAVTGLKFTPNAASPAVDLDLIARGLCFSDEITCGQADTVGGYIIQLLNLYPYPDSIEIKDSDYFVRLKIDKE